MYGMTGRAGRSNRPNKTTACSPSELMHIKLDMTSYGSDNGLLDRRSFPTNRSIPFGNESPILGDAGFASHTHPRFAKASRARMHHANDNFLQRRTLSNLTAGIMHQRPTGHHVLTMRVWRKPLTTCIRAQSFGGQG